MIENKGKKYYTTYEIKDMVNEPDTELHKLWFENMPHQRDFVLIEQVNRIMYEGKNNKHISVAEFTRTENGKKKYFAFLIDDVFEYVKTRESLKQYNVKFTDKE